MRFPPGQLLFEQVKQETISDFILQAIPFMALGALLPFTFEFIHLTDEASTKQIVMPDAGEVSDEHQHFSELITKLDSYFKNSSDVTVHLNIFSSIKQDQKETLKIFVCDWHVKQSSANYRNLMKSSETDSYKKWETDS